MGAQFCINDNSGLRYMTNKKLPQLTGQWVNLVALKKPPIQLPNRPTQQIDSYSTIWQKDNKLWSGDSSGTVDSATKITLYGDQVPYTDDEILWSKKDPLNVDVRTVDIAGMWLDEKSNLHTLAQKYTPVTLMQKEVFLGKGLAGSITGYSINVKISGGTHQTGTLSKDCFTISWSNGSTWKRHLNINGHWVSNQDISTHEKIHVTEDKVTINGITGQLDRSIWYLKANKATPFPTNKKEGGIDFDNSAIHWYDYVGWLRVFLMDGKWVDRAGNTHTITNNKVKDPSVQSRFTWEFDVSSTNTAKDSQNTSGEMIRNWIEIGKQQGVVHYDSTFIDWENGDIWEKQSA